MLRAESAEVHELPRRRERRFLKDHSFIAVKKNAVFHVPANRPGEDHFLEIAAFADEIFDGIAVRDPDYILFDDRTVVEDFGDIVAGRPDQFYAALEGLMVGTRADESGKKRVVNVDDALRIALDEIVGENLHVAGEDHKVGFMVFDQRMDLLFSLALVFFRDRDDLIGNFVEVRNGLIVGVVGNNQRDVTGKFAALVTIEQIDQAVIVLRDENDHARAMRGLRQAPIHLKLFGDGREVSREVGEIFIGEINVEVFGIELDAHQEEARFFVGVFVSMQDVAAVAVDKVGDGGDFALAVGAGDEQDGGGFHSRAVAIRLWASRRLNCGCDRIVEEDFSVPQFFQLCVVASRKHPHDPIIASLHD